MVDIGNLIWISVFGFILVLAATLSLAWFFNEGKKHRRIVIVLIILLFFGLMIYGLSLQEISRIENIGRPMAYKNLKDGSGYEVIGAIGKFVIIAFESGQGADVRTIFDFPKKLEIGSKFSKKGEEVIDEVPFPRELPKISI